MTSESINLAYRAIIDYLGGHTEDFKELATKAMVISGKEVCTCGGEVIACKYGHKKHYNKAKVCTSCGTVYLDGKKIWRGISQ